MGEGEGCRMNAGIVVTRHVFETFFMDFVDEVDLMDEVDKIEP